ncbi:MAG: carboxyl-terminal processing protease [Flavobacteriales bacterium]|jgi:carboxyl-terminal processing protease
MQNKTALRPIFVAIILAIGVLIGVIIGQRNGSIQFLPTASNSVSKVDEILSQIQLDYIEEVNTDSLLDIALGDILKSLDPHSSYIPAKNYDKVAENIEGSFDGIGVQFSIQEDTIIVESPIIGGPSEALGIKAGDRIITVDGELVAGVGFTNTKVIKSLRGPKGSIVKVGIYRKGNAELLDFDIKRDKIPVYSIETSYLLEDEIGYIKLSRFASQSYEEFVTALIELQQQGANKLVFDLRGNPGGLLHICGAIADELLPGGKLIVYTKGRTRKREDIYATQNGRFKTQEIVILIDEGSASASEIIAGALQDNDRAKVIGRRSFGKGLVQEPRQMSDGSAIHLTTARYYTPTGRCIQKSYENGIEAYQMEQYQRFDKGTVRESDSSLFADSLRFVTPGGKVVYGGGGIMPDIYVPVDTAGVSDWYYQVVRRGNLRNFCFEYADTHREELLASGGAKEFHKKFNVSESLYKEFYNSLNNVTANKAQETQSKYLIKSQLKALIGRQIFGNEAMYREFNSGDPVIKAALKELNK